MAANAETIRGWANRLYNEDGLTHMIVVTDTFDYEDYPVYVATGEDIHERLKGIVGMNRVTEVYSRNRTLDEQMAQFRAYNLD